MNSLWNILWSILKNKWNSEHTAMRRPRWRSGSSMFRYWVFCALFLMQSSICSRTTEHSVNDACWPGTGSRLVIMVPWAWFSSSDLTTESQPPWPFWSRNLVNTFYKMNEENRKDIAYGDNVMYHCIWTYFGFYLSLLNIIPLIEWSLPNITYGRVYIQDLKS